MQTSSAAATAWIYLIRNYGHPETALMIYPYVHRIFGCCLSNLLSVASSLSVRFRSVTLRLNFLTYPMKDRYFLHCEFRAYLVLNRLLTYDQLRR